MQSSRKSAIIALCIASALSANPIVYAASTLEYLRKPMVAASTITTSTIAAALASSTIREYLKKYQAPITGAALTAAGIATLYKYRQYTKALTWPWKLYESDNRSFPAIATDFPKNFLWGVGTSAYQVDGNCPDSTYEQWAKNPYSGYVESAGMACDHWNNYKHDIALMKKELGVHAYRFSIEWSKIEPREGQFNQESLNHYVEVCKELMRNGITPVIGLHHYSDPQWFMDAGGFAQEKNIAFFVRFCSRFFNELSRQLPELFNSPQTPMFLTFNSPASYAANGYYTGTRPPGEKNNMQKQVTVIKNMLESHVQVYQAIKQSPYGAQARVGITHNIFQLDPYHWFNPIAHLKCAVGNELTHNAIYRFFTTGVYAINIPTKATINHTNHNAPRSLDFIGLNYYGHGYMSTTGGVIQPPNEIPVTERYTVYGEGLYRAIKELSDNFAQKIKIPIYVTEHGIGTDDNALRQKSSQRSMYALSRAIKDGYDVRGCMHWSLMDNFEWESGYTKYRYGLLTRNRVLKPGAHYLAQLMQGTAYR